MSQHFLFIYARGSANADLFSRLDVCFSRRIQIVIDDVQRLIVTCTWYAQTTHGHCLCFTHAPSAKFVWIICSQTKPPGVDQIDTHFLIKFLGHNNHMYTILYFSKIFFHLFYISAIKIMVPGFFNDFLHQLIYHNILWKQIDDTLIWFYFKCVWRK